MYLYSRLSCKKQPRLYNSFKKYGFENHKFEIIHICEIFELNDLEVYYIELYQSFASKHGLNLRTGGNSGGCMSEESKKKVGDKNRGRKVCESERKRMSVSGRNSENKKRKIVYQFNKEGILVESFKCARVASEKLNIPLNGIRDCCKKYQPSAYGYYWSYDPNFVPSPIEKIGCKTCGKEIDKTQHNKLFCSHECWDKNYKVERSDFIKERSAMKYQKKKMKDKLSKKPTQLL